MGVPVQGRAGPFSVRNTRHRHRIASKERRRPLEKISVNPSGHFSTNWDETDAKFNGVRRVEMVRQYI